MSIMQFWLDISKLLLLSGTFAASWCVENVFKDLNAVKLLRQGIHTTALSKTSLNLSKKIPVKVKTGSFNKILAYIINVQDI